MAEEGARRRLRAQSEQVRGWVSRSAGGSWLRTLREAEKLMAPLRFTSDPDERQFVLDEDGECASSSVTVLRTKS